MQHSADVEDDLLVELRARLAEQNAFALARSEQYDLDLRQRRPRALHDPEAKRLGRSSASSKFARD
jgi:hypothetical protein